MSKASDWLRIPKNWIPPEMLPFIDPLVYSGLPFPEILNDEVILKSLPFEKLSARRQILKRLCERDGYKCNYCGVLKRLEVDHIHPTSKGGTDEDKNLQVLCATCNSKKGAKIV